MRKPDACPKCAHHDMKIRYEPAPAERLHVECATCGFAGTRPCADARGGDVIDYIQRAVAERFGITVDELLAKGRRKTVAEARHIACYLCRTLPTPPPSYPDLGRRFRRDHTTVMGSVKRGRQIIEAHPALLELVETDHQLTLPGVPSPGLVKGPEATTSRSDVA